MYIGCGWNSRVRIEVDVFDGVAIYLPDIEVCLDLVFVDQRNTVGCAPDQFRGGFLTELDVENKDEVLNR